MGKNRSDENICLWIDVFYGRAGTRPFYFYKNRIHNLDQDKDEDSSSSGHKLIYGNNRNF